MAGLEKISQMPTASQANLTDAAKLETTDATVSTVAVPYNMLGEYIDTRLGVYNVMDPTYSGGVVINTGINDASLAAQSAANAASNAGGGIVYFPPGTYLFAARVNLAGLANVFFLGAGINATTLKPKLNPGPLSGFQCSIFSAFPDPNQAPLNDAVFCASNLAWDRMTIDMDYNTIPDGGVAHTSYGTTHNYAADNYQYPIFCILVNGVYVGPEMRLVNGWYNAIEIYTCNDVVIASCRIDHVGDKANYLGHYTGIEIDGFSHRTTIRAPIITNGGIGILINADNNNSNPDGVAGTRDVAIDSPIIDTMTNDAIDGLNYIDGLVITTPVCRNIGGTGIAVTFPNSASSTAKGAHNVSIIAPQILNYNTAASSGASAMDLMAQNLHVLDPVYTNSLASGTGKNFYGVVLRQLTENSVDQNGGMIRGAIGNGSFENGYGILCLADYFQVDATTIHDTSGAMTAAVLSNGTHSPAATNTLTIP